MSDAPPSPIGPAQAELIARPVSIIVGSRDAALRPHVMRAVACRLSDDLRRVTVLMSASAGGQVLDDLRANGLVAVVFSEPSSHRTLQLKGRDATVGPCDADDAALAGRHLGVFVDEICRIGLTAEVAHTLLAHQGDLAAVRFTVDEAFEQTPGPSAGERLPPRG